VARMAELGLLKRSLIAFAVAIGFGLTEWQAAALSLETRVTTIMAGRQLGKSRALAILALWWSFRRRNQHVLIVSASDHAARRVLALARAMAAASPWLSGSVVDEQRGLLKLSNGSVIRSVAASESAVRGWTVDLLLIDEAALLSDDLITDAALPTTAARRDARIVLASSATTASGAFYDLQRAGELGDEHVRAFKWVARAADGPDDAPWISPTAIAVDRAAMSPARFDAEHRAIPSGGGSALFSPARIERMFRFDYQPDTLATMYGPARVCWGQDWGASSDRSAGVALGRIPLPGGGRLFAVRAVRRWDAGALLPGVVREIAASPAHFQAVVPELNGLGAPCAQMLWAALEARPFDVGGGRQKQPHWVMVEERGDLGRAIPERPVRRKFRGFITEQLGVTTTAQSKAAVWSGACLAVDKGELIASAQETDLRRELALLEVELTPSGGERIQASTGHDDLADALYLACVPYREHTGEWSSRIADFTDPRFPMHASTGLPPEVAASPHLTDSDGLSIPARPCWQSIVGLALTVPEGLEFSTPVDPRMRAARERVRDVINTQHSEVNG
jgi:hypothetical protein